MDKEVSVLTNALKNAFQDQYATLADCLEGVMPTFAKKLYEKKLISRPVMRSENYDKIVYEFLQGLQFVSSNELLEKHCHLFIKVLREMGGATMNGAARHLSSIWTEAAKKSGIDFQLPIERKTKEVRKATKQQKANIVTCKCDVPAILLTVKKNSVNKGCQFWKCPKGIGHQCDFFEWADGHSNGSLAASSSKYSSRQCQCGLPVAERTSQKMGPNKGRLFYNCPKDQHEQCGYFEWAPKRKMRRRRWSRRKH